MFRKAFALAAAALCASAASAASTFRVTNIASYITSTTPAAPYTNVLTLKAGQVYDYKAPNGASDYLTVQCPAAKSTKIEKAFISYITISTGDGSSDLDVYDARSGNQLGSIWAIPSYGYGSILPIMCVNGRITTTYNEAY